MNSLTQEEIDAIELDIMMDECGMEGCGNTNDKEEMATCEFYWEPMYVPVDHRNYIQTFSATVIAPCKFCVKGICTKHFSSSTSSSSASATATVPCKFCTKGICTKHSSGSARATVTVP